MSEEAKEHYARIYTAIQHIPPGRVTTYGAIAELIGKPRNARQIGYALKSLPNEFRNRIHETTRMALQFDPRDGFLDERMFIGGGEDSEEEDEEEHGPTGAEFHSGNVPWWRVIGAGGVVPVRANPRMRDAHVARLQDEGVVVTEYRVSMKDYGWDPPQRLAEQLATS